MALDPCGATASDAVRALTDAVRALTGAVAHDMRTPLTAVSGEIELALRRPRPESAYRDALARIRDQVAELIHLTGDLAFTSDPPDLSTASAPLGSVLAPLAALAAPDVFRLPPAVPDCHVRGEAQWLARAISLIVHHGIRHRTEQSVVSLRIGPPVSGPGDVDLVVEAWPGFRPHAWRYLEDDDASVDPDTPGLFRLTTATRILHACGARAGMMAIEGRDAVQIRCVLA